MSDKSVHDAELVSLGERLAASQAFATLFRDGMALVEETAAYLDGPGRKESKALERAAALAYATESMRLTTRLMQLASWLLLHRAVNEGEVTLAQATREKSKINLSGADKADDDVVRMWPQTLRALVARSLKLQDRLQRLDATIHAGVTRAGAARTPHSNPVGRQVRLLKAAFERRGP
jgi:regulator of CtrA degradation